MNSVIMKCVLLLTGSAIVVFIFQSLVFLSFRQNPEVSPNPLEESQKNMSLQLASLAEKIGASYLELVGKVESIEKILSTKTPYQQSLDTEEALRWTGYLIQTMAKSEVPLPEKRNRLSIGSEDFTEDGMFKIPEGIKRLSCCFSLK